MEEPVRITKRDLERLVFQRELMRRAQLTAPPTMLPGEVNPQLRRFAQETFLQMKMINPDAFRGKTVDDWEKALKQFIMTRRPEFRQEVLQTLKARYGMRGPKEEPPKATLGPEVLMMGGQEEVKKESAKMVRCPITGRMVPAEGRGRALMSRLLEKKGAEKGTAYRRMMGWKEVGTKEITPEIVAILRERVSEAPTVEEFPGWETAEEKTASAGMAGIVNLVKMAKRDMPSFLAQDRPEGQKKIYRAMTRRKGALEALRRRYGNRAKEVAARVAGRQGKAGKQPQGPPYKAPI